MGPRLHAELGPDNGGQAVNVLRRTPAGLIAGLQLALLAGACGGDAPRPVATVDPAITVGKHEIGVPIQLAPKISFTITSAIVSEKLATSDGEFSSGQPLQDLMLAQIRFENFSDLDAAGPELRVVCTGVSGFSTTRGSPNGYDHKKILHPGEKFEGFIIVSYPRYCEAGVLAGIFPDGIQIGWVLPPGTQAR